MASKKHSTDGKQCVWCKLHLATDINTHEMIAAELSASNVTNDEVLPHLFKQTHRRIHARPGDGAYDTIQCYEAVSAH
ncbi:transposase [Candidatus Enterovibrio altilux]|nr:transposase [Candidatus Enterovibrio luxaltus]